MARIDSLANILWEKWRGLNLCSCHDETGDVTEYDDARAAEFERTASYANRSKLWDVCPCCVVITSGKWVFNFSLTFQNISHSNPIPSHRIRKSRVKIVFNAFHSRHRTSY